jgi:hypothetical protein
MSSWRYFISSDEPDSVETGTGALLRLEQGDPWALAEVIRPTGEWVNSDRLARYHLLGSTDTGLSETTPARALQIVQAWYERGRLSALPASLPGADEAERRSPEEETARQTLRERARATQDEIERVYAAVPTPPGSQAVQDPGAS